MFTAARSNNIKSVGSSAKIAKTSTEDVLEETTKLDYVELSHRGLIYCGYNVNLTNLATRKHGSEADFLFVAEVNILCSSAGSKIWFK